MEHLKQLIIELPHDPEIPLRVYIEELKEKCQGKIRTLVINKNHLHNSPEVFVDK